MKIMKSKLILGRARWHGIRSNNHKLLLVAWVAPAGHQEGNLPQESMAALGQRGCGVSLWSFSGLMEIKRELAGLVMVLVQARA